MEHTLPTALNVYSTMGHGAAKTKGSKAQTNREMKIKKEPKKTLF